MSINNYASIETDRSIGVLLGNFSDDFIRSSVEESLQYKFRPFNTRMPNFPAVLKQRFTMIKENTPEYIDDVTEKELEVYNDIIDIICENYNLSVVEDGIPDEYVYTVCYYLYQFFISEFSERTINFLSNYSITNVADLLSHIPNESKTIAKTNYSKKIYTHEDYAMLFDNVEQVLDIISGIDLPFQKLIIYLADSEVLGYQISALLSNYIVDCGDIYKYHFVSLINNTSTRIDIITAVKINISRILGENNELNNILYT